MTTASGVYRFTEGPTPYFLFGDRVTLHYFLTMEDQSDIDPGYIRVWSAPYTLVLPLSELELVTDDEFEDMPEDFTPGQEWWDSLDDDEKEEMSPSWIYYLG